MELIFQWDVETQDSLDIEFCVGDSAEEWMGKMPDEETGAEVYWIIAGQGARHDYKTFEELTTAKLFDGRSLKEVWGEAKVLIINEDSPEDWLRYCRP
ncbi:hypothetical protein [Oscillibacter sp.]|uniref:hypothetical protein n=1 Tax=Oscillibacter sp. TaxID=1945593 RepID=UPI00261A31BE|nr:hypothetical protein [Oscillibacter sp.]MDD3347808.1 hypothetical protein [Oscillibacter sp.]